jgi:TolB-like protein
VSFFAELKRRNVIRMAGLYLVGAWLLIQIAETLLPIFHTPDWVLQALVVLLALGLLPALVFSWVYELTPDGLRRDAEVDPSRSIAPRTAQRMDRLILAGLAAVILVVAADRFWPGATAPDEKPAVAGAASTPAKTAKSAASEVANAKSIAVLPFADFSPGGDQAWFADGLAEEILNALARTPDLQVAARTSSFRYKGSTLAITQIAAELGVAHVLEGSVRSTAQRVRVTAQLIRAADGFHVWSQNYDRDPADMIEIQEDLARQIATAMQTSMDPQALAAMARVGTASVEAYQAYVQGVGLSLPGSGGEQRSKGYALFEEARALDPGFAAAHARAANYWLIQLNPARSNSVPAADESPEAKRQRFRERIELAIQHAISETDRLAFRAQKALLDLRLREAISLQRAVLAERPHDRDALVALSDLADKVSDPALLDAMRTLMWPRANESPDFAVVYLGTGLGLQLDLGRAADEALELVERWPDNAAVLYQAHRTLLWDRRVDAARQVLERWRETRAPSEDRTFLMLAPARQACAEGRRDEVERVLAEIASDDPSRRWLVLMLLGRQDDAAAALMPFEREGNPQALAGFLAYPEFDPSPFPSLVQVLEREQVRRPPPLPIPFACPPGVPRT